MFQIMIVDDSRAVRAGLERVFRGEGYDVATAGDGREALEQLESGVRPDLILVDLLMPGMDGVEFHRKLKSSVHLAMIPVVVLSASEPDPAWERELAGTECIGAPIDIERLIRIAERYTGQA